MHAEYCFNPVNAMPIAITAIAAADRALDRASGGLGASAPRGTATPPPPARSTTQSVLAIHRWHEALLGVRVSRDTAFRFVPGHYARLGLPDADGVPLFRPLSVASSPADAHLDFLCTLVPGGAFSARLAALRVGDIVEVERPSYGFLTLQALAPGADLWMLASGTGIGPYLSMLHDPQLWTRHARVALVHSVRRAADLAYADELRARAQRPPADGAGRFLYEPVVTREPGASRWSQRLPQLFADGRLPAALAMPLDVASSRVMVCGHPALARDMRALLDARGFVTSRRGVPGQMAFEQYWQEPR